MLGLGFGEIILILIVALLVLGPEKLPQIARQLGKGLREFRRLSNDFQHNLHEMENETKQALDTPTAALSVAASGAAEHPAPSQAPEPPAAEPALPASLREPGAQAPMETSPAGPSVTSPESGAEPGGPLEELAPTTYATLAPSHTVPRDNN